MYKTIQKIQIITKREECPDYSYLGEFSNIMGAYPVRHSKTLSHCTWFNANNVTCMEQAHKNYDKMKKALSGTLYLMDITAKAFIAVQGTNQVIESSGHCEIESNSDISIINNIKTDEIEELRKILISLGFETTQINNAYVGTINPRKE